MELKRSKYIQNSPQAAFTLIEMLVVVFVLGIGLIGALSFFNINLNNQFEAKNELIAAGLAQEGSDLVRNIVDHSYLNELPWYDELINKKKTAKYCQIIDREVLFGDNFKCRNKITNKDSIVCFDSTDGVYHQAKNKKCASGESDTGFMRSLVITLSDPSMDLDTGGGCLQVVATVGWPSASCTTDSDGKLNCPKKTESTDIICKPRQ